jgi:hypothetical protein
MIDAMTPTDRAVARVLLVEQRDTVAPRDPNGPRVRRYRLARVPLKGRPPAVRSERLAQLRRLYD